MRETGKGKNREYRKSEGDNEYSAGGLLSCENRGPLSSSLLLFIRAESLTFILRPPDHGLS